MEKTFEQRVTEARAAVPALSPEEANACKLENPEVLFFDPRETNAISTTTGRIPGALNMPLAELAEIAADALPGEFNSTSRPIITACQGGPLGAIAAHLLKRRGFTNVAFIDGGTQGWIEAGYPTVH